MDHAIDHAILKGKIRRVIRCEGALWLLDLIIDASNPQEPVMNYFPGDTLFTPLERRRGLPIGNLASEYLANFYLDGLDHFVKETLRCPAYLRYVDDFALFSDSKAELWAWRRAVIARLGLDRLAIHESRARPHRTADGLTFLGLRVWPGRRRLERANVILARRRLKAMAQAAEQGYMLLAEALSRLRCWLAHAAQGDTRGIVRSLLASA